MNSPTATDHPRIRGEHPLAPLGRQIRQGSSPHTRGALDLLEVLPFDNGIIPAYAGSTCEASWKCLAMADHPRIRGEHERRGEKFRVVLGSSPHTRGAPRPLAPSPLGSRIIPAYAGSTRFHANHVRMGGDHPRIRGEHFGSTTAPRPAPGSSPHTRGALDYRDRLMTLNRIIPAYAGSTCRCR